MATTQEMVSKLDELINEAAEKEADTDLLMQIRARIIVDAERRETEQAEIARMALRLVGSGEVAA